MGYYLSYLLMLLLPTAIITFFIVSLVLFLTAKLKNKKTPSFYSEEQVKTRRICLIISSVLLGSIILGIVFIFSIFLMAISFM